MPFIKIHEAEPLPQTLCDRSITAIADLRQDMFVTDIHARRLNEQLKIMSAHLADARSLLDTAAYVLRKERRGDMADRIDAFMKKEAPSASEIPEVTPRREMEGLEHLLDHLRMHGAEHGQSERTVAVEMPFIGIQPDSQEEWELEQRVFEFVNDAGMPAGATTLVSDLWHAFCDREIWPSNAISPEAYADFPEVSLEDVAAARKRLAKEFGYGTGRKFTVIDDVDTPVSRVRIAEEFGFRTVDAAAVDIGSTVPKTALVEAERRALRAEAAMEAAAGWLRHAKDELIGHPDVRLRVYVRMIMDRAERPLLKAEAQMKSAAFREQHLND